MSVTTKKFYNIHTRLDELRDRDGIDIDREEGGVACEEAGVTCDVPVGETQRDDEPNAVESKGGKTGAVTVVGENTLDDRDVGEDTLDVTVMEGLKTGDAVTSLSSRT